MAFPVTLNGRTYTLADFEGNNYVDGLPDAFEDFVTQAGDIYNSTSTSSVAIGTGSKTFTTADSGKPYQAGTPLRIADAAAPSTNFMDCIVTSYSGTTLVVDVIGTVGSGTKSSWTINIGGTKTVGGGAIVGDSISVTGTATVGDNVAIGVGNGDGYGITFNSATHSASTTLDYYEEGSWTPVISDSDVSGNNATFSSFEAKYTRIGNVVTCTMKLFDIDTTGMSPSGFLWLKGLPFVVGSGADAQININGWSNISLSGSSPVGLSVPISASNDYGVFHVPQSSGSLSILTVSQISSGSSDMRTSFSYLTNT